MKFVKYPNFTRFGPMGDLQEIICKVCGVTIAGTTERVVNTTRNPGGSQVQKAVVQFVRFHNYAELKISFTDGSAHMTNGCSKCLHPNLTPTQLDELQQADMEEQTAGLGYENTVLLKARIPVAVVGFKKGGDRVE